MKSAPVNILTSRKMESASALRPINLSFQFLEISKDMKHVQERPREVRGTPEQVGGLTKLPNLSLHVINGIKVLHN